MRFFRRITHVCQNCVFGDNKQGERLEKRRFKKNIRLDNNNEKVELRAKWHIFCKRKNRLIPWNRYKRCFIPENWVIKSDLRVNRNGVLNKTECIILDILERKWEGPE